MKTNCRVTTYNRESKMAPSRGAGPQASPPMSSGPVRGAQSGDGVSISSEAKEAEPDRLPVCLAQASVFLPLKFPMRGSVRRLAPGRLRNGALLSMVLKMRS